MRYMDMKLAVYEICRLVMIHYELLRNMKKIRSKAKAYDVLR
jgi:hypothetical protein